MATFRVLPEDFRVSEIPLYPPSGEGPHTFVRVEKRLTTTEAVARRLAAASGVSHRVVGYAGRKDARAVTEQWFSLPELDPERAMTLVLEGARVLDAVRHRHKLRTGQLKGNRFEIVVREVDPELARRVEERLAAFAGRGFPNRYGRQRFGRDGRNAERGVEILSGRRRPRDRRAGRFLVSALQSSIFNAALSRRALGFDQLRVGDVAVVHASGGLFEVLDVAREQRRCDAFEISPTGPIFGRKMRRPSGETLADEEAALGALGLEAEQFDLPKLSGARRSLRARPMAAELRGKEDGCVQLCFTLAAGAYATVLLEELFAGAPLLEVRDEDQLTA